jgi:AraC-like DNA-binding protein
MSGIAISRLSTLRDAMMSEASVTADLLLRGGAALLNLFVAVQFARMRPLRFVAAAGSLFAIAAASYGLASSNELSDALGDFEVVLVGPAVAASAFLWWFALSLFRDEFRWRPIYATPLVLLLALSVLRAEGNETMRVAGELLHQAVVVLLLAHIVSLALHDLRDDLVDARRRFRLAVALALPLVGFIIAATETYRLYGSLPAWLGLVQAIMLAVLSFAFTMWTTEVRYGLLTPAAASPQPRADLLSPAERIELQRLKAAIGDGACFEPELSLGALARRVGMPEHRLRRLINKGLGYRNFATFLNDHRVTEAKRQLADPARARDQVASIAFGLGYASLAPFNRAFRELTGLTPTDYRARMLARRIDFENS